MFDLNKWLALSHYDDALLLSKRSAKLSYANNVSHKLKWGLSQQDDYFLRREAVWTGRAEGESFLSRRNLHEGRTLLLLEFLDGTSLSDFLRSKDGSKRITFHVIPFIESLFYELDTLHKKGIVHGDVKASNVIVSPNGRARLIDYAAANWIGSSNDTKPYLITTLSYALPDDYTQTTVLAFVDWHAFFIIVDLVNAIPPVTLKTLSLTDYISYRQQQLCMTPIDDVIKSKLLEVLDDFRRSLNP